jgi:sugar lactone lactonase YvrE
MPSARSARPASLVLLVVCFALLACADGGPAGPAVPVGPSASARVLARGAPIRSANGLAFDAQGRLYVASVLGREIVVLDAASGAVLDRIGRERGVDDPDDVTFGPDGSLYWTAIFDGEVGRLTPTGVSSRMFVGVGANSIAFSRDGRLFIGLVFLGDRFLEVDPEFEGEPRLVLEGLWVNGTDWGSDGALYGSLWGEGAVARIDVDAGTIERVVQGLGVPAAVAFDAGGRLHVLDALRGEVVRLDASGGGRSVLARLSPALDNLAFSPSGGLFVSNYADGSVVEVLPGGATRVVSPAGLALPGGLAVLAGASGDAVFVADWAALREFDGESGAEGSVARVVFASPGLSPPLTASADGNNLLLTSTFSGVQVWDPRSAQVLSEIGDFAGAVQAIRFGGDLVVSEFESGRVVRAYGPDGVEREELATGLGLPSGLAASDDDLWVADWERGEVLQLVADGEPLVEPRVLASGLSSPEGLAVDSDGGLLVVESGRGRLSRIDPVSGTVTAVVEGLATGLEAGPDDPPFGRFTGVAVGVAGAIYVSGDAGNLLYRIDHASGASG